MSVKIQLKHSATKDKAPQPTDLIAGELGVNTHQDSPALYLKDSAGAVRKIAGVGAVGAEDASETVKGVVELATAAETTTGTDATRAVTPAGLKVELDKKVKLAGDTMTGNLTVPSINSGPLAGFRNQIINGDFRVWQRGDDFVVNSAGDAKYTADRWFAFSESSALGKNAVDTPEGLCCAFVTKAAGENLPIRQAIELSNPGKAGTFTNGSTWTLSFWAKGSGTGHVYDTTVGFAKNAKTNPTTPFFLNVAGAALATAWTRYSHTFTVGTAPAAADASVNVTIVLKNGSGFSYIAGVQLEPGPVATPFERRPIGTELALCQRFYQIRSSGAVSAADLRPTMRATPTISGNNYDADL